MLSGALHLAGDLAEGSGALGLRESGSWGRRRRGRSRASRSGASAGLLYIFSLLYISKGLKDNRSVTKVYSSQAPKAQDESLRRSAQHRRRRRKRKSTGTWGRRVPCAVYYRPTCVISMGESSPYLRAGSCIGTYWVRCGQHRLPGWKLVKGREQTKG